jgi:hypothetical protein
MLLVRHGHLSESDVFDRFGRYRNCMVEVDTWSLHVKVHPEKIRNQKKISTVIDREFFNVLVTVEFFGLRMFL